MLEDHDHDNDRKFIYLKEVHRVGFDVIFITLFDDEKVLSIHRAMTDARHDETGHRILRETARQQTQNSVPKIDRKREVRGRKDNVLKEIMTTSIQHHHTCFISVNNKMNPKRSEMTFDC